MRVSLVKEQTIINYSKKHAESVSSCMAWIKKINKANWNKPEDMNQTFPSVSFLGKGSQKAIFNIGGNNHRIICKYRFGNTSARLYIHWLGTHAEYTKLCDKGDQYRAENHKEYS